MSRNLVRLFALLLIAPAPASAYLDPSAGSMIFQMTVGGLLAAGAAIRLYWKALRNLLSGKARRPDSDASGDSH